MKVVPWCVLSVVVVSVDDLGMGDTDEGFEYPTWCRNRWKSGARKSGGFMGIEWHLEMRDRYGVLFNYSLHSMNCGRCLRADSKYMKDHNCLMMGV